MKKRFAVFLSFCLALVLLAGAMPNSVHAKSSAKKGKKSYSKSPAKKSSKSKSSAKRKNPNGHIPGTNVYGRTGLFFTDTAEAPSEGSASVTGHLLYGSGDELDTIQLPVGVNLGLVENLELSAGIDYARIKFDYPGTAGNTESGLNVLTVGGKYVIPRLAGEPLNLAVGLDISHGPLTSKLGNDGTDFTLKGIMSYTLMPQKVFLNGGIGLLFLDGRDVETQAVDPLTGAVSTVKAKGDGDTVFQLNGGMGLMLNPDLMAIAELGINQLGDDSSILSGGLRGRASDSLTWQALLGIGLNDNPSDFVLVGGLTHRFSLR